MTISMLKDEELLDRDNLIDEISRRLALNNGVNKAFQDSIVYAERLASGTLVRRYPRLDRGESVEHLIHIPYYVWEYGYQASKIVDIIKSIDLTKYRY